MEVLKKKKDKKLLKQYLVTYIIVLIIPLIICSSYYIRVLSVISADDMKAKQEELHHSVGKILTDQFFHITYFLIKVSWL